MITSNNSFLHDFFMNNTDYFDTDNTSLTDIGFIFALAYLGFNKVQSESLTNEERIKKFHLDDILTESEMLTRYTNPKNEIVTRYIKPDSEGVTIKYYTYVPENTIEKYSENELDVIDITPSDFRRTSVLKGFRQKPIRFIKKISKNKNFVRFLVLLAVGLVTMTQRQKLVEFILKHFKKQQPPSVGNNHGRFIKVIATFIVISAAAFILSGIVIGRSRTPVPVPIIPEPSLRFSNSFIKKVILFSIAGVMVFVNTFYPESAKIGKAIWEVYQYIQDLFN
jgi:hypothetical protein